MRQLYNYDQFIDQKSSQIRLKLLSLGMIRFIITTYEHVFAMPSPVLFSSEINFSKQIYL